MLDLKFVSQLGFQLKAGRGDMVLKKRMEWQRLKGKEKIEKIEKIEGKQNRKIEVWK